MTSFSMVPTGRRSRGLVGALGALSLILAACGGTDDGDAGTQRRGPESPPLPSDSSGYTDLVPSADTVIIYVSAAGNDSNDGLTPETPVKTPQKGISLLREGYPDWLLFKRGDAWDTGLGGWKLSGRSPTERMVIGAYGEGERPRFAFSSDSALFTGGGVSAKESMDNLAFVSLHLLGANHDLSRGAPSGKNQYCVQWLRGARDVLFEDIRFEYCQVNLQAFDGIPMQRLRFFRNLFLDSYSLDDSHAQGIYLDGVTETVLEENVFDHCGWHPDVPSAVPTIFNHCIYWQQDRAPDGIVRNNLILRGSSHGAQMRSSGRLEGNVFAGNAIGGFLGGEYDRTPAGERQGYAIGNLFTEGQDTTPREGHGSGDLFRGWAFELITGIQNVELSDNIVTHCRSAAASCRSLPAQHGNSLIRNNVVWDWANTLVGNLDETPGPFKDPDRTIASYHATLGGAESFEAFANEARKQSKTNFRPAYTARAVIAYFREGFEPAE